MDNTFTVLSVRVKYSVLFAFYQWLRVFGDSCFKVTLQGSRYIILFLFTNTVAYAQPGETTAANFLKLGIGARPASLAGTFIGIADDVNALYWNPAGILQIPHPSVSGVHTELYENIRNDFVGYVYPYKSPLSPSATADLQPLLKGEIGGFNTSAVGLSIYGLYMNPDIERRTGTGTIPETVFGVVNPYDPLTGVEGYFGANSIAAVVSYAQRFYPWLFIGSNIKFISESIDVYSGRSIAVDLAALCLRNINGIPVRIGAVLQNFGPDLVFLEKPFPLPLNLGLGGSVQLLNRKLTVATDVNFNRTNTFTFSCGVEYRVPLVWVNRLFTDKFNTELQVRAGYKYRVDNYRLGQFVGLATGAGIKINEFSIDYAFTPYLFGNNIHQIAINLRLPYLTLSPVKEPVKTDPWAVLDRSVTETQTKKAAVVPPPVEPEKVVVSTVTLATPSVNIRPLRISPTQSEYEVNVSVPDGDLTNLTFKLGTVVPEEVKISVDQIISISPELLTQLGTKKVYTMFRLKPDLIRGQVYDVKVTYRIKKSWVTENNVDISSTTLAVSNENQQLTFISGTEPVGEDETYFYFISTSSKFVLEYYVVADPRN